MIVTSCCLQVVAQDVLCAVLHHMSHVQFLLCCAYSCLFCIFINTIVIVMELHQKRLAGRPSATCTVNVCCIPGWRTLRRWTPLATLARACDRCCTWSCTPPLRSRGRPCGASLHGLLSSSRAMPAIFPCKTLDKSTLADSAAIVPSSPLAWRMSFTHDHVHTGAGACIW
jgi:hypothetical protein